MEIRYILQAMSAAVMGGLTFINLEKQAVANGASRTAWDLRSIQPLTKMRLLSQRTAPYTSQVKVMKVLVIMIFIKAILWMGNGQTLKILENQLIHLAMTFSW